ncbi:MAG: hypothetical protein ACHP84_16440, partial [Caulobacterales bacterium]
KAGTQAFLQSVGAARVWTEGTNKKRLGPRLRGEFRVLVFGGVRASVPRHLLRTCYASITGLFGACYDLLSPVPGGYQVAASH